MKCKEIDTYPADLHTLYSIMYLQISGSIIKISVNYEKHSYGWKCERKHLVE